MASISFEEFSLKWKPRLQTIQKCQEILFQQTPDAKIDELLPQFLGGFSESDYFSYQIIASLSILFFSRYDLTELSANLLVALKPYICQSISEDEFLFIISNNYFILRLYQEKAITQQQFLLKLQSIPSDKWLYFHDIIQKDFPSEYEQKRQFFEPFLTPEFLSTFEDCRKKGLNNHPVALAIRYDDLLQLQSIISSTNLSIEAKVPLSIFERVPLFTTFSKGVPLIEYAAYYGSINCFKFLLMSGSELKDDLFSFAIFGGNYDIIHILEDHHAPISLALRTSICIHQNELTDYFRDSHELEINDLVKACSINNYNMSTLLPFLCDIYKNPNLTNDEGQSILTIAISHHHYDIVDMLLSIPTIDVNYSIPSIRSALEYSVLKNNMIAFQKLIKMPQIDVHIDRSKGGAAICIAVKNNCLQMVKEIVNHKTFEPMVNDRALKTEIHYAIDTKNNEILNFLCDHPKYKDAMERHLAYFVIYAATKDNWAVVDILIEKVRSFDNLLNYLHRYYETGPRSQAKENIYQKLKQKIEPRRYIQPVKFYATQSIFDNS